MWCHNATCRTPPQLQGFDVYDLASLRFASRPALSVSLPPSLLLLSLSLHLPLPTLPPLSCPAPLLHKPEHNTQLKTLCPKATYSEPQDRLRDFRDCLWVLYTVKIPFSHELFFFASFDLYLSCTTFEIACGFSIRKLYYTVFICILSSFISVLPNLCILSIVLCLKCNRLSLRKCVFVRCVCACCECVSACACVRACVSVCVSVYY